MSTTEVETGGHGRTDVASGPIVSKGRVNAVERILYASATLGVPLSTLI